MNISEIVSVPEADRNPTWENNFFQALSQSQLHLITAEPQNGPDGWPYLLAETEGATTEPATESVAKILQWLTERGIGLVVNPRKEYPDYVFTYGMLWSFRETGFFFKPMQETPQGVVQFETNAIIHAGEPTTEYLPGYVRKILKDFFRDQGVLRPRILMLSQDKVNYDLAISLESLGNPPATEHAGIGEAVGWFLPPHYSLLLISEAGLPAFFDL